jgi:hypothetical protein
MEEEITRISFVLPIATKKALWLVAADRGTTASDLLRDLSTDLVKTHKEGVFFDMTARDAAHSPSDEPQGVAS